MGIWIEYRCENRTASSSGDRLPEGKRCLSHDNAGPMDMADDTRESVVETLKFLDEEARQSGWKKTRAGWICPFCIEARKSAS